MVASVHWLELQLTIDSAWQPEAEAALESAGTLSITLLDAAADTPDEAAIFEPDVGDTPLWPSLTMLALFTADADRAAIANRLGAALPQLGPDRIVFREVADRDWQRAWMDRFHPMRFGRRLWIYPWNVEPPAWHRPDATRRAAGVAAEDDISARAPASGPGSPRPEPSSASGAGAVGAAPRATSAWMEPIIVRLNPGLAFGSGTHPTTALCLEWLDALDLAGRTVVDYGCGSGVLAIAALKLGAARAIGVDHDPQALVAARDNAERNGVDGRLSPVAPGDLGEGTQAGALVANILSEPLLSLAPRFAGLLLPDAPFALSGILAGQEAPLLECYAGCGFADLAVTQRAGWLRIDGRFHGIA